MSSSSLHNLPSYEELYPDDGNPPTYYDQTKRCSFVNDTYFDVQEPEPLSNSVPEENPLENIINHLFLARIGGFEFGAAIRSSESTADRIASNDVEVEIPEVVDDLLEDSQMERTVLRRHIISEAISGTAIISTAGFISFVYLPVMLPLAVLAMCFHVFTIVYKVWYFRMRFGSFADELHVGHDE